jgi:hypothetical protein
MAAVVEDVRMITRTDTSRSTNMVFRLYCRLMIDLELTNPRTFVKYADEIQASSELQPPSRSNTIPSRNSFSIIIIIIIIFYITYAKKVAMTT